MKDKIFRFGLSVSIESFMNVEQLIPSSQWIMEDTMKIMIEPLVVGNKIKLKEISLQRIDKLIEE